MLKIGKNLSEWSAYSCQPKTTEELRKIIEDRIKEQGPNCDLNDIDVSLIEDMSYLFSRSNFNGDISKWNKSKVKNMELMFYRSKFNQPIGNWDVSKVKSMNCMFYDSNFNKDISNWKILDYCDTNLMFSGCPIKEKYKPKSLQK